MDAMSLMRSARAASLTSRPATMTMTIINAFWIPLMPLMFRSPSERQYAQEETSQPAHDLGRIDKTVGLELESRIRDLRRVHRVLRRDHDRIDDAGEAHELFALFEPDLLLAGDQQIAV